VFLLDIRTKATVQLTGELFPSLIDSFSPDGRTIFVAGNQHTPGKHETSPGVPSIVLVGDRLRGLIDDVGVAYPNAGVVSPDGSKIVFTMRSDPSGYDLFVIDRDGSIPRRLTSLNTYITTETLSFTPDGKRVVFLKEPSSDGSGQICIVGIDGRGFEVIADNY
jgi:Tol biopolymer transport system component